LKKLGVSVELRVSELTAERDLNGNWTYHPHANVVINCTKRIDWQAFLAFTTANMPGHWRDCGRLIDANEAVKYFVKPGEVMDHKPLELADLFFATAGLRLATPMGAFRELGRTMKVDRVKLAKRLDATRENWEWCFVRLRNPNQHLCAKTVSTDNQVMGLLPPQPRFSSRFEPCLLVKNYKGDLASLLTVNELESLFRPSQIAWATRSAIRFTPSPQLPKNFASKSETKHQPAPA
jgi:hypothetical protein